MQFYRKQRKIPFINIVSMVDILTILLIFFIVTTKFKKEEPQVQIKLPESATAEKNEQQKEPMIIYATRQQQVFIAQREVPISQLASTLRYERNASPQTLFALKADKEVPLGFFVKVLDASKEAGIQNLSLFTDQKQQE